MNDAGYILFDEDFNGKTLFKNQMDLVGSLMSLKDSSYYTEIANQDEYQKVHSRLKAYVSQLLSSNITRSITEDFKYGLFTLIETKLGKGEESERIYQYILADLKLKNSVVVKKESQKNLIDEFTADFNAGYYISIFTSTPLEVEAPFDLKEFSLRKVFFQDLIESISNKNKKLKHYRFNFPTLDYVNTFWRGVEKMLLKYLRKESGNRALFETFYSKFIISPRVHSEIENGKVEEEYLMGVVREILRYLFRNKNLVVLHTETPIYSLPIIAINPSEIKNRQLYSLFTGQTQEVSIYKFTPEEMTTWRIFVWDKINLPEYAGLSIEYPKSLN